MAESHSTAVTRSGFVTALAWSFIILGGIATVVTLVQTIIVTVMFPMEEMRASMRELQKSQPMPPFFMLIFENVRLISFAAFVSSVVTLVASIGLLMRRNWARLVFIVVMTFGVIWNLAGLGMPFFMSDMFPEVPGHVPPGFHDNFKLVWNILIGFSVLMCLVFAGLFVWVVKRLLADDIKREFQAL